jgi:hypothetical protein
MVKFVSSPVLGVDLTYHVQFTYEPSQNFITWTLDTDQRNDIDDVKGHWHVEQTPKDSSKSRVYYETGIALPSAALDMVKDGIPAPFRAMASFAPHWLKEMVVDKVGDKAIGGAISWLRDGSEVATENGANKLRPFQKFQPVSVDAAIEDVLKDGKVWKATNVVGNTAIGQAVMDVEATPGVVWDQLFDFASYPEKAPKVSSETEVYKRETQKTSLMGGKVERTSVKFVSPVQVGIKLTNHLDFTYDKSKNSATWQLDTAQKNDLDELQGHWHVERHPDDPRKARVFFEVGIVGPKWLPRWMMDKLMQRAINQATSWVKTEAELIGPQELTWGDELGELFEVLSPYIIASVVQVAAVGLLKYPWGATTSTTTSTATSTETDSDEED